MVLARDSLTWPAPVRGRAVGRWAGRAASCRGLRAVELVSVAEAHRWPVDAGLYQHVSRVGHALYCLHVASGRHGNFANFPVFDVVGDIVCVLGDYGE